MTAKLPTRMVEKPWGKSRLAARFGDTAGRRIGEVWFEPPTQLPQLLVKYIFTSEKLSVQVHPSDDQLPGHGKEECWLVIGAEPGASLGIGFKESLSVEAMRASALDGSIERLLEWYPVAPGDFFYIPAGTVHAIGAGVSLIEVQQTSDVTYRLYDYGRPRELHLDEGLAVAVGTPHAASHRRRVAGPGPQILVDGPKFRLDRISAGDTTLAIDRYTGGPSLVIPLDVSVTIGTETISPGECGLAGSLSAIGFASRGNCLIAQPCM